MKQILITGAIGQIGSELAAALRAKHGADAVLVSDLRSPEAGSPLASSGPFEFLDCLDTNQITRVMQRYEIGTIYHLAAILSAVGERKPTYAWHVNMDGLYNMLEAARQYRCSLFFPSSIGAFGPTTPKVKTPQTTIQRPTTMYGITKLAGELLCDYYFARFGVDTRGLRFPGLISHETEPGGGTTDFAVKIFSHAANHRKYRCYVREDTRLDMMYMPDAIDAMIAVMEAESSRLKDRNSFNVTGMSVTPTDLANEIRKHVPNFQIDYEIDPTRQAIADSWPDSMDDSAAREQWGFSPKYDLARMTVDMLEHLSHKTRAKAANRRAQR